MGHLVLAETAREVLALDRVLFIPTRQPPHKSSRDLLPGATRLKLVQLAIRDHPAFVASDIELQRQGPSYSIETVKMLRKQLPAAKTFLLIGEDMLSVRWIAWEELKRLCTVVVAPRPRGRPTRREVGLKRLAMPRLDIASSEIRRRLQAGRSIRYLVPASVERYIRQHQLYGRGGQS
jgi:nicotinate-nucleotide adenylyltransferase